MIKLRVSRREQDSPLLSRTSGSALSRATTSHSLLVSFLLAFFLLSISFLHPRRSRDCAVSREGGREREKEKRKLSAEFGLTRLALSLSVGVLENSRFASLTSHWRGTDGGPFVHFVTSFPADAPVIPNDP